MFQKLNKRYAVGLALVLGLFMTASTAVAQTSTFTYQGRLTDGGAAANGNYDLQFSLFDSASAGTQIGATQTVSSVSVSGGVFTVTLDFGANAFPGANRFLEIGVRAVGGGSFTVLTPRQQVTSTPYAIRSANASAADTATNANQLGGVAANQYVVTSDSRLSDSRPPTAGSSNYIQNTANQQASSNFNISGNGTVGATLSGNIVNATTQYNINGTRMLSSNFNNTNLIAGAFAGSSNTIGFSNAFFGYFAGSSNTAGSFNAFFGEGAGSGNTTGLGNTFVGGSSAGNSNTSGNRNTFLGVDAGSVGNTANTIGSDNTIIGGNATTGQNNLSNATAIGAQAQVDASNSLVLGSINGVNGATANTKVGIGTTSPTSALDVRDGTGANSSGAHVQIGAPNPNADEKIIMFGDSGCSGNPCVFIGEQDADDRMVLKATTFRVKSGNWAPDSDGLQSLGLSGNRWSAVFAANGTIQTSDARFKQRIANLKYGLSQVMQLRPVSFQWKEGSDKRTHFGLLAQEVEPVLPEAVEKEADARAPLGMNYSNLIPVLIKAIQEQERALERGAAEIKTLRAENELLNKEQRREIEQLKAQVRQLQGRPGVRRAPRRFGSSQSAKQTR